MAGTVIFYKDPSEHTEKITIQRYKSKKQSWSQMTDQE